MQGLDGKIAIITGGASGIGAAAARLFAAEGAHVVVGDIVEDAGRATAASLGETGRFLRLDVTDASSWDAIVALAQSEFGSVDVLVNAAGIIVADPIIDGDPQLFRKIFEVNQFGTYLGVRACAKVMAAQGGGSIVNISSTQGIAGMPGVSAYVASKFAVRGFTKAAALELARLGIRVNSIHPGITDTPMLMWGGTGERTPEMVRAITSTVPLGRLGASEEVAATAVFLASDASAYCTGAEFVVDGGLLAGTFPPAEPT